MNRMTEENFKTLLETIRDANSVQTLALQYYADLALQHARYGCKVYVHADAPALPAIPGLWIEDTRFGRSQNTYFPRDPYQAYRRVLQLWRGSSKGHPRSLRIIFRSAPPPVLGLALAGRRAGRGISKSRGAGKMQIADIVRACGHNLTPKVTCNGDHPHGPWCLAIEDPYCIVGRCWGWYCSAGWSIHFGHAAPVEAIISDLFSALLLERGYEPSTEGEGQ